MMNKRPWQTRSILPLAAVALLVAVPIGNAEPPPSHIDLSKLKYQESEVVIPNPSEVFAALDKMGSPNWHNVLAPVSTAKPSHPPEIAMLLGAVIANGFIAVEAKEKDPVENIGRKVIDLANSLGVGDSVRGHANAIIEAARNDHWDAVRTELDKAKSGVSNAMGQLHSKDQAELVSIVGWLRGTQALTALIMADYKAERAELLHQPDILATFEKQFDGMPEKTKENKRVVELREGLKKVKTLILSGGGEPVSQTSVEEINSITNDLLKSVAPEH